VVRGADFSSANDSGRVDAALAERIGFAFVKLTQGTDYTSPAARWQLDRLRAHGVKCGVYHWLSPGVDAVAQWQHLERELVALPYWRELIVALDYEEPGTTDALARAFIAAAARAGFAAGLYSSAGTHGYANVGAAFRWVAKWAPPTSPPPRACTFWQFTSGGNTQDYDLFVVGDVAALHRFWSAHAGRRPLYFVAVAGKPAVRLGPFRSWLRAAGAGAGYMVRHPVRSGFRVDRVA
jgi:GH25 family lysozyme M1 (1,4-beta-N-acetylmuramidase)